MREGAFTFILSIVLYQMVKNELLVGFNTFLSAAAAIASYVIEMCIRDRYSARAGKPLTREEFLAGVLRPGEPHPYRKIWLDVSRETMLSAAGAIGQAVRAASKQAKVGLMSSAPHIPAAEGRDWHALLHTLAAGRPPVDLSLIHI